MSDAYDKYRGMGIDFLEAADAIKELETQVESLQAERDRYKQRWEVAEGENARLLNERDRYAVLLDER